MADAPRNGINYTHVIICGKLLLSVERCTFYEGFVELVCLMCDGGPCSETGRSVALITSVTSRLLIVCMEDAD